MEKVMKLGAKFLALVILLAAIPFVFAYFIGFMFETTNYWLWVKVMRVVVLALIIFVPMLVQKWRERQRFFFNWVMFLLLYVVVTMFLWIKGF